MSIRHLSMSDRSRIEVYLELGWSISRIAGEIKFSKQAISREVRRNQNRQGNYTAITADRLTKARRHQANQQFRILSTKNLSGITMFTTINLLNHLVYQQCLHAVFSGALFVIFGNT